MKFTISSENPKVTGGVKRKIIIIDKGIRANIIQGIRLPHLVCVWSDIYPSRGSLKAFQKDQIIKAIDIRTTFKRADPSDVYEHLNKMKEEVYRIIKANISPNNNYQWLIIRRKRDLSDKMVGSGRMVIDVQPRRFGS